MRRCYLESPQRRREKSIPYRMYDNDLEKRMHQLEEQYNFFASHAFAVITVIGPDGIILQQSPSIKQILGYDHRKRLGKNFLHSRLVHPDDIYKKEQLFEKAKKNPNINYKDELRMQHKNGSWSWMEVIFNNQLHNPYINGIVVITHDITERKILELQKDEFLSIVSHEMKTPLTIIRSYSQLMAKRIQNKSGEKEALLFLDNIANQTDKITRLITDLLDISKIQTGKLSIEVKPFQLQQLIRKTITDFRYASSSHSIRLTGSTKALVAGDESRIGQVVINLLTNAIKYSPKSKRIQLHIQRKRTYIITSVMDYGIGIPASKQKYIFQRFFRINERSEQHMSLGLGLYIASEIIKLHHGTIWVESKKGKGSTFSFSLPIYTKKIIHPPHVTRHNVHADE